MAKKLIRNTSLSEQLFEILKEALEKGKYQEGDKLPSEAELAQKYAVSRLTVRAAIARLNALSYVETRVGEGTFVKAFNRNEFLQKVSSTLIEPEMLDDINDFRRLIDVECVRLTILNASAEELQRLKQTCDDFNNYLNQIRDITDIDEEIKRELVERDYKFHLTICELSKNSLYPITYMTVQEMIKQYIGTNIISRWRYNIVTNSNDNLITLFTKGHIDLYNAIVSHDFATAKRVMLSHLDYNVMSMPKHDFSK